MFAKNLEASVAAQKPAGSLRLRPRQLLLELQRLQAENEELRRENIALRGEVTRLRLYNEMEVAPEGAAKRLPDSVPEAARKFYSILPRAFEQVDFFRMATDLGFSVENSQRIMGIFLRERLLIRNNNDNFEKADLMQYELPLS